MINYTDLPNSLSDGKSYLTAYKGKNALIQQSPMWVADAFSRTSLVNSQYSNASLQGRLILIHFKDC